VNRDSKPVPSTHRDLDAWKKSVGMARLVYEETAVFPKPEQFGLTHQMRRAAVSVASNIAEGAGRRSSREFVQFLSISAGSLAELDTQMEIAAQLGYLSPQSSLWSARDDVARLVIALRQSIQRRVEQQLGAPRITNHESRIT
jgi:four helix bundle protein